MIKLIEDIRQNITELQEGINFFHFWTLEKLELDLIYHTLERFFLSRSKVLQYFCVLTNVNYVLYGSIDHLIFWQMVIMTEM